MIYTGPLAAFITLILFLWIYMEVGRATKPGGECGLIADSLD
jgi:hypothetical protein